MGVRRDCRRALCMFQMTREESCRAQRHPISSARASRPGVSAPIPSRSTIGHQPLLLFRREWRRGPLEGQTQPGRSPFQGQAPSPQSNPVFQAIFSGSWKTRLLRLLIDGSTAEAFAGMSEIHTFCAHRSTTVSPGHTCKKK